jgi:hypothetical protein
LEDQKNLNKILLAIEEKIINNYQKRSRFNVIGVFKRFTETVGQVEIIIIFIQVYNLFTGDPLGFLV